MAQNQEDDWVTATMADDSAAADLLIHHSHSGPLSLLCHWSGPLSSLDPRPRREPAQSRRGRGAAPPPLVVALKILVDQRTAQLTGTARSKMDMGVVETGEEKIVVLVQIGVIMVGIILAHTDDLTEEAAC